MIIPKNALKVGGRGGVKGRLTRLVVGKVFL
jgi:hypothetical protein